MRQTDVYGPENTARDDSIFHTQQQQNDGKPANQTAQQQPENRPNTAAKATERPQKTSQTPSRNQAHPRQPGERESGLWAAVYKDSITTGGEGVVVIPSKQGRGLAAPIFPKGPKSVGIFELR